MTLLAVEVTFHLIRVSIGISLLHQWLPIFMNLQSGVTGVCMCRGVS